VRAPVTTPSVSGRSVEAVVTAIRDAIRRQELNPGEQIRQVDWAERVGVSRVPVREALNSLALVGVLTHDPNRGFFLPKYTQQEMAQLYYVRSVLEVECVRALRWPADDELELLRVYADGMAEAIEQGDAVRWLSAHDEFHSTILSLSPLSVLVEEAERLYLRTEGFRSLRAHNALERSRADGLSHSQVLEALKNRDRETLVGYFTRELQVSDGDLRQWTRQLAP
jgi:DNA-binding GntR family transcriptional regulator